MPNASIRAAMVSAIIVFPLFYIGQNAALSQSLEPLEASRIESEVFDERVKSSGAVIAGVMMAGRVDAEQRPDLRALLSERVEEPSLCLDVTSQDGRYQSIRYYELPSLPTSFQTRSLDYETSYGDYLADSKPGEIGIQLAVGDCGAANPTILPVTWNAQDTNADADMLVLVNSNGADSVFLYASEQATDPVTCEPLEAFLKRSFDFTCTIPASARPTGNLAMELLPYRGGEPDEAVRFTVLTSSDRSLQ